MGSRVGTRTHDLLAESRQVSHFGMGGYDRCCGSHVVSGFKCRCLVVLELSSRCSTVCENAFFYPSFRLEHGVLLAYR